MSPAASAEVQRHAHDSALTQQSQDRHKQGKQAWQLGMSHQTNSANKILSAGQKKKVYKSIT